MHIHIYVYTHIVIITCITANIQRRLATEVLTLKSSLNNLP